MRLVSDHLCYQLDVSRVDCELFLAAACPAGWVSSNGKFPGCLACPSGTYQNRPSNKVCNQCPPNTTTNETGATTMDQCYSMNATKGTYVRITSKHIIASQSRWQAINLQKYL